MEHQQWADETDGKAGKYFAEGVMLQDDACRTQYPRHEDEEA